jgi:hypothetical protein
VEETISATIELQLQQKKGNTIFSGIGRNTALEVHGDIPPYLLNWKYFLRNARLLALFQ